MGKALMKGLQNDLGCTIAQNAITSYSINNQPTNAMLRYAVIFLVIALIAGLLGFAGLSGTAAWIAKLLVVVFLVLFVISLLRGKK